MSSDRDRQVSEAPQSGPGSSAAPDPLPAELCAALAALTERLDREHERAAHRETIIDRLHEENQRLRRGELAAMLEPACTTLLRLYDRVRQAGAHWTGEGEDEPGGAGVLGPLLDSVAGDVLDALARLGVERFAVEPGAPYDAARHRPVRTEPVDGPRDGTVVRVLAEGFEQSGRIVRKAEVCVGRASPAGDAEGHNRPETLRAAGPGETMNTSTR
ncbi:nucleotide exchange factor GrpE [Actinomadura macrotermitis]|uniref:Protein GrpE n=1 Tax=Actinomadura macrotermitis TaxID=2585200 RepID=A0A7K0C7U7_9ACTN|nr:Protein GrpE [Actinomadura macrotermitis]